MSSSAPSNSAPSKNTSTDSSVDWEKCETPREGLVAGPNGAHLALIADGQPRQPGDPVVILESGHGVSGVSWAAVQRLLDKRVRSYTYDRAGYGRSPISETPRNAAVMAAELLDMLKGAGVPPPYIVAAHSYGGIIAREFLAAAGIDSVVGMVLVDANQETTHRKLRVPNASLEALAAGRNYFDMIGLLRENDLKPEELGRLAREMGNPDSKATAGREGAVVLDSSDDLAAHRQLETQALGTHPVTVIRGDTLRDFTRFLAVVEADGDPAPDQEHLTLFKDFVDNRFTVFDRELQTEQLQLSSNSRFVQTTKSGHAVLATEPQLVADEILAMWESTHKV